MVWGPWRQAEAYPTRSAKPCGSASSRFAIDGRGRGPLRLRRRGPVQGEEGAEREPEVVVPLGAGQPLAEEEPHDPAGEERGRQENAQIRAARGRLHLRVDLPAEVRNL